MAKKQIYRDTIKGASLKIVQNSLHFGKNLGQTPTSTTVKPFLEKNARKQQVGRGWGGEGGGRVL